MVPVQMDWELGAGSPSGGRSAYSAQLTPSLILSVLTLPPYPQTHRLMFRVTAGCCPRPPPWARRSIPPQGLGRGFQQGKGRVRGKRCPTDGGAWARGQSVVHVWVRVHTHALLGKSVQKEAWEWQVYEPDFAAIHLGVSH